MTDTPTIRHPQFPGATKPVEYEIEARYTQDLQPGRFTTAIPGSDGIEAALRIFHALAGTRRDDGTLNLIAWTGADRQHSVGLIIAQHTWDND